MIIDRLFIQLSFITEYHYFIQIYVSFFSSQMHLAGGDFTIDKHCSSSVTISYSAAYKWLFSWAGSGFATCGFISRSLDNVFYRLLCVCR